MTLYHSNIRTRAITWYGAFKFFLHELRLLIFHQYLYHTCIFRPYWRCYFPNTQAIIYVVDSSDTDRLVTAKEEFHAILEVMCPQCMRASHLFQAVCDTFPGLIWLRFNICCHYLGRNKKRLKHFTHGLNDYSRWLQHCTTWFVDYFFNE